MKKFSTLILASLCLFFVNSAVAQNLPSVAAELELTPTQSSAQKKNPVDLLRTTPNAVISALPENATVLWGGPGDANGEFDGGLNDWTTEGFVPGTTNPEPLSLWTYEPDADINEGGFAMTGAANEPMESPSAANGAAAFNSDFYDNGGLGSPNIGMGPLPGPHLSHLISPVIDMSNNSDLAVSFFSFRRRFQSATTISYSNDGGMTWSEGISVYDDTRETRTNGPVLDGEQLVYLPGAGGTDQFQFRFTFDGNYYFWMIDDVALIEAPRNDISIGSFFYTPAAYAQPLKHIDRDTFAFSMDVSNRGTVAQSNVVLGAQVRDIDFNVIYETELEIAELATGVSDSLFELPGTFIPDALEVGEYFLTYTVESDSLDQWDVDNLEGDGFAVTEFLFSQDANDEGTANEIFTTLAGAGAWQIGNSYTTALSFGSDVYTAETITFAAQIAAGATLEGQTVNIWLCKFTDEPFDNMARFDANAGLEIVGFHVYQYTADDASGDRITVPLEDFNANDNIILEEDQEYLALIDYSNAVDLRQGFNTSIDYRHREDEGNRGNFLAFNEGSNSWFGLFTDSENLLPIVRLELGLLTGTNNQPLPESTLNVQPNPTSDLLTVNIDLETASQAVLTVTDITGKIMDIQEFDAVDAQSINMNVSNYANGTYLVRLATEAGARTVKVLVQH